MAADYELTLADLIDGLSAARFVARRTAADVEVQIQLDDREASLLSGHTTAELADAIDLALAVYVADRLAHARTSDCRHIHIALPGRHPEVLGSQSILDLLGDILFEYTGDVWTFEFYRRTARGRLAERQPTLLPVTEVGPHPEVALWSGGLDALAGLYHRRHIAKSASAYLLFGTGGNSIVHARQHDLAEAAKRWFPDDVMRPIELIQFPIRMSDTGSLRKNSAPRARGFVFLLLGCVCAVLAGMHELHVYENGVGAINLPYRASEIGTDHSKAVHPIAIRKMAQLASQLLGVEFVVRNPFELITKGQLCTAMVGADIVEPIHRTISCDRRHRSVPAQCGRCSSCLLRRQALAVNNILEPAESYVATFDVARGKVPHRLAGLHLQAMLAQVEMLKTTLAGPCPWSVLATRHPYLSDLVEAVAVQDRIPKPAVISGLLSMYATYVGEWERVAQIVARGLLPEVSVRAE